MSNHSLHRGTDGLSGLTLTERVRARVAEVGRTLEDAPSARSGASAARREARSIGKVYVEMRTTYRSFRRRTKRPAVPELRRAVQAFKRGPSLASLVAVATILDDRSLLDW